VAKKPNRVFLEKSSLEATTNLVGDSARNLTNGEGCLIAWVVCLPWILVQYKEVKIKLFLLWLIKILQPPKV